MATAKKKTAVPKRRTAAKKTATVNAQASTVAPVAPEFRVITIPLHEVLGRLSRPAAPMMSASIENCCSGPVGCCDGPSVASVKISDAGETAPLQPLALRAADIDYDGWEAAAMVGIDGITDERRGRRNRRGLFSVLRGDEYKRKLVTLHIREQYEAAHAGDVAAAAGEPGRFERILKFIYDHREEILAFVQRIVELFSGLPA